ncbi:MAG: heavy metal translocating P-type ATPase [Rhizobiales bacterium]|nr:heavy metal translocating P-type ATPase [Hyphomicrobiales bacterium]
MLAVAGLGVAAGFLLRLTGHDGWTNSVWAAATLPVLASLLVEIAGSLRRGDVGLDIVAALSMTAALIFGEYLAAAVVALMYAGGQYLESYADRRAGREMTALLARVPRSAIRRRDHGLEEVPLDAIAPGDRLVIRSGEVVPVDGVSEDDALLDYASLTGESLPVPRRAGEEVLSGAGNLGQAFDLTATRRAEESTFAGIVRLVAQARLAKAPMTRMADRYAIVFLIGTVVLAGGAWLFSGDPIRGLSVLVIATPCPLILAVPVALVSGLSRAASSGVLVKGGGALEAIARVKTIILDKTGTLTGGEVRLVATHVAHGVDAEEALRLAASLDQASTHVIARALVAEAQLRKLRLVPPRDVVEYPGQGVSGEVECIRMLVGGLAFVEGRARHAEGLAFESEMAPGAVLVALAIDGKLVALFILADLIRAGARELLQALKHNGIERVVIASGDLQMVADHIADGLPVDLVKGEMSPEEKVALVLDERRTAPVMMVGDGINDAPALTSADIGVAMGAKGAAASAEAADAVILLDRIDPLLPAVRISHRAIAIARQSVGVGLGLSIAGMIVAALGYLTPVQGALIQEAIDVAVILNALRVLRAS